MTPVARMSLALLLALVTEVSSAQNQSVNTSANSPRTYAGPSRSSIRPHLFGGKTQRKVGTLQSQAKGFDMRLAPTEAQMWTWWLDSPYSDIGVYFGGCNAYLEQFVINGQPSPDP